MPSIRYYQTENNDSKYNNLQTENTVRFGQSINTGWNYKGVYAGAQLTDRGMLNQYTLVDFPNFSSQSEESDLTSCVATIKKLSGISNLRFMVNYGSTSNPLIGKIAIKWTGINDEVASAFNQTSNNSYNINAYDPYKKNNKNFPVYTSSEGSPFNLAPLKSLKINNLILVPYFTFYDIQYSNEVEGYPGYYKTRSIRNKVNKTWEQIKPEDKTPAGADYETYSGLFNNSYIDLGNGVYRCCMGVKLVPYYGESNYEYDSNTDDYSNNPDPTTGITYGNRNALGSISTNEPPDSPYNNFTTTKFLVMIETYNEDAGGIIYSTIPGIEFSSSGTVITSEYGMDSNFVLSSNYQTITSEYWNPMLNYINNKSYGAIYNTVSHNETPKLVVQGNIAYTNSLDRTADAVGESVTYSSNIYIPNPSAPYNYKTITRTFRTLQVSNGYSFSINQLWSSIASLGCYVADSADTATKAALGVKIGNNNHVYLGEMLSNGTTTGNMLQGSDIELSVQAGIDDILENTPYQPSTPGPGGGGGGGGDGDSDTPESAKDYSNHGDPIGGLSAARLNNLAGNNPFVSYYKCNGSALLGLSGKLWSAPGSFYKALQYARDSNQADPLNYITTLKIFPRDISASGDVGTNIIYMGSGGSLNISEGTLLRMNNTIGTVDFGTVTIAGEYEDFRDYEPYTTATIAFPMAGSFELKMSEVCDKTLSCTASIDYLSGVIAYQLYNNTDGYLITTTTAVLGVDLPITALASTTMASNIINGTFNQIGHYTSGINNFSSGADSFKSGDVGSIVKGITGVVNGATSFAKASAENALKGTESVTKNSASPCYAGWSGVPYPYITVKRPKSQNPGNYGHQIGYYTNSSYSLSNINGYVVCRNVDTSGINNATSEEKQAIKELLESGVYL